MENKVVCKKKITPLCDDCDDFIQHIPEYRKGGYRLHGGKCGVDGHEILEGDKLQENCPK